MDSNRSDRLKAVPANGTAAVEAVTEALSRLRYGGIELTVHDGKVVQIDVTERRRFT